MHLSIPISLLSSSEKLYKLHECPQEPTSGLDARAAAVVMRAVRNTVDTGRAH